MAGPSQGLIEIPLSTREAMARMNALEAALKSASKEAKNFFQVQADGSLKALPGLDAQMHKLEAIGAAYRAEAETVKQSVAAHNGRTEATVKSGRAEERALWDAARAHAGYTARAGGSSQASKQFAYAIQDFISAGGMHNFAMGMRGATNNLEAIATAAAGGLSPLKMLGVSLLPTAALAAVDLAMGFSKADDKAKDAAKGGLEDYRRALERIKGVSKDVIETELEMKLGDERRAYAKEWMDLVAQQASVREKMADYGKPMAGGWIGDKPATLEADKALVAERTAIYERERAAGRMWMASKHRDKTLEEYLSLGNAAPAFKRLQERKALETEQAALQSRIDQLARQEKDAIDRINLSKAIGPVRGKLVDNAADALRAGVKPAEVQAQFEKALLTQATPDIAKRGAAVLLSEAQDKSNQHAMDTALEMSSPIGKLTRQLESAKLEEKRLKDAFETAKLKNPSMGIFAQDQLQDKVKAQGLVVHAIEEQKTKVERALKDNPQSMQSELLEQLRKQSAILESQLRLMQNPAPVQVSIDGAEPAPPPNNIVRNNANAWPPVQGPLPFFQLR